VGLTHDAEVGSDCRQFPQTADLSFHYFSNPPIPLVVSPVCVALYRCVLWDLPRNVVLRSGHACRGPRVVLRGFVVLPLFAQGQHYVFYLSCTTGGGGSVSLITDITNLVDNLRKVGSIPTPPVTKVQSDAIRYLTGRLHNIPTLIRLFNLVLVNDLLCS
jgi:hypothetical protein